MNYNEEGLHNRGSNSSGKDISPKPELSGEKHVDPDALRHNYDGTHIRGFETAEGTRLHRGLKARHITMIGESPCPLLLLQFHRDYCSSWKWSVTDGLQQLVVLSELVLLLEPVRHSPVPVLDLSSSATPSSDQLSSSSCPASEKWPPGFLSPLVSPVTRVATVTHLSVLLSAGRKSPLSHNALLCTTKEPHTNGM